MCPDSLVNLGPKIGQPGRKWYKAGIWIFWKRYTSRLTKKSPGARDVEKVIYSWCSKETIKVLVCDH